MVRKFCCIVCLAALWATPGAWARGEALDVRGLARSAHEVLYQARKDVEEERFAQARDRILKHLESHPRHAHSSLYLVLGHAYRLERRMEEALEAYEKACGMKPRRGNCDFAPPGRLGTWSASVGRRSISRRPTPPAV